MFSSHNKFLGTLNSFEMPLLLWGSNQYGEFGVTNPPSCLPNPEDVNPLTLGSDRVQPGATGSNETGVISKSIFSAASICMLGSR